MSIQGDPRRPQELHPFIREKVEHSNVIYTFYTTMATVMGISAFALKVWNRLIELLPSLTRCRICL